MSRRQSSTIVLCLILIALLPTLLAARARGAEITREFNFTGGDLRVANLIGAVEVRQGSGEAWRVTVNVRGDDATPEVLQLVQEKGSLEVVFPLEKHHDYVYPALGHGSHSTFTAHEADPGEKSWLRRTFGLISGHRVTVRGSGKGLEVWADLTIEVPRGGSLELRNGFGDVSAADLEADLDLDTDVGSATVERLRGDLNLDTGSGGAKVTGVTGDLVVDTGSGEVELRDCDAQLAQVDTGSGDVRVQGLRCRTLKLDTGSGAVTARGVAADEATIDTGSGDVELQLDRLGDGRFDLDTGSGDVELALPAEASARIVADTGSGGVESDVPGARFVKLDDGTREMTLGGGSARVRLDTGSGSVVVSRK